MSDLNDQLVDVLQQRKDVILALVKPLEDSVKSFKAELDSIDALLQRYGAIREDVTESVSKIFNDLEKSGLPSAGLPDRAAKLARELLMSDRGFDELSVRQLLDGLPPLLRSKYNGNDNVAIEALRAQIRNRQQKYGLVYRNGLISLAGQSKEELDPQTHVVDGILMSSAFGNGPISTVAGLPPLVRVAGDVALKQRGV